MMGLRSTLAWVAVALAALVSGCETTTLRSAWFDTEFSGPPMRKIVVLGGGISSTDSRVFEDQFVEKLRAAGLPVAARASAPRPCPSDPNSHSVGPRPHSAA